MAKALEFADADANGKFKIDAFVKAL
eukprot:SAG11_NODE_4990_length_1701_cov_1.780899_4_plen_25_part_01